MTSASPSKRAKSEETATAPSPAASPALSGQLHLDRPQIAILDFGSQFSHLIARRVRELNVFCELYSCRVPLKDLANKRVVGVILSGGPASVYDAESPHADPELWGWLDANRVPVLGICYGMQEMTWKFRGKVEPSEKREYGKSTLEVADAACELFRGVPSGSVVWMSHGDKITVPPAGFKTVGTSDNSPHAAMAHESGRMFGIQFHPEVTHSVHGKTILGNFCLGVCRAPADWVMDKLADKFIRDVRVKVGDRGHVLGAVSGGVDSSVAAVLMNRAIGSRFHAIMVDNGCLRKDEGVQVVERLKKRFGIDLHLVDASERFMKALESVTDPERKRKIIGNLFIEVFQEEAERIRAALPEGESIEFLLQGTLYPDVIESISYKGPSATIKTHHNVGGLPANMRLQLIEPLRELFKDEVRTLGEALGLDHESVWRHPFPGPGLAIRIIGEVTKATTDTLRLADDIMIQEIRKAGIYDDIAQAFVVLLPTIRTVGVMGDGRTYGNVAALRFVTTTDFMTADWYHVDPVVLGRISSRIVNEVPGVTRCVYDVTSKPPGTVEWE